MSAKRKRVVLTIAEKIEIINLLKDGVSAKDIANSYGVGVTTVFGIKKNSESIESFVSVLETEEGSTCRKTMKKAKNSDVEDSVYQWYLERKSLGEHITGTVLCEKALWFNQELGGGADFKASKGWLRNFKSRHGIRDLELPCENALLSPHKEDMDKFVSEFASLVESENYDPDLVYNAKATCLNWKSLPKVLESRVNSSSGDEMGKDLLSLLLCCNSTGKHKLNMHLVGKLKCPKALSSASHSPVTYVKDKTALINDELFVEWYDTIFIPEIKKYQEVTGKLGKVLLLLSNSSFTPSSELLDREEGHFKVKILPDNVTPLLEPMSRGICKTLKNVYKKQVLRRFLLCEGEKDGVMGVYNNLSLKSCAYILADAWSSLKEEVLQKAWGKIFGRVIKVAEDTSVAELLDILKSIPGCSRSGSEEIVEWIKSDEVQITDQSATESRELQVANGDEQENDDEQEEVVPSHDDIFRMLDKLFLWCERQIECSAADVYLLRSLRDLAAVKRLSPERQVLLNSLNLS